MQGKKRNFIIAAAIAISWSSLLAFAKITALIPMSFPYRLSTLQYPDSLIKNYCNEAELVSDFVFDKYYHRNNEIKRIEEWLAVKSVCNSLFDEMVVQCDKDKGGCRPDWYREPAKINNKDENCHLKLIHYCSMAVAAHSDNNIDIPLPDFSKPGNINACIGGSTKLKKKIVSRVPGEDGLIIFDNVNINTDTKEISDTSTIHSLGTPNYMAALGIGPTMDGYGSIVGCKNGNCNKFLGCLAINFSSLGLNGENTVATKNSIIPYPHGIWSTQNKDALFKTRVDIDPKNKSWNQELSIICRQPTQVITNDNQRETTIISCAVNINEKAATGDVLNSIYKVEIRRKGGFDNVVGVCNLIYENNPSQFEFCTDGFEVFLNLASFISAYGYQKAYIPFFNPTVNPALKIATNEGMDSFLSDSIPIETIS